jgi:hypothetical protein
LADFGFQRFPKANATPLHACKGHFKQFMYMDVVLIKNLMEAKLHESASKSVAKKLTFFKSTYFLQAS